MLTHLETFRTWESLTDTHTKWSLDLCGSIHFVSSTLWKKIQLTVPESPQCPACNKISISVTYLINVWQREIQMAVLTGMNVQCMHWHSQVVKEFE